MTVSQYRRPIVDQIMTNQHMIWTILAFGVLCALYQALMSTVQIWAKLLISCILIGLFIPFYWWSKGFSWIGIIGVIWRNIDADDYSLQHKYTNFCCNVFFVVIIFCTVTVWILIDLVIVYLDDQIINIYISQIIEVICGAKIAMALVIMCDQMIVCSYNHELLVFTNTNYQIKLWFLWHSIILVASVTEYMVTCEAGVSKCHKSLQIASFVFGIVLLICYYSITYNSQMNQIIQTLSNAHAGNTLIIPAHLANDHDYVKQVELSRDIVNNNGAIKQQRLILGSRATSINKNEMNVSPSKKQRMMNWIKQRFVCMSRQISTVLIITNAAITATCTMSLYVVIESNINTLKQDYPFVKYNQQLTKSPTASFPTMHPTRVSHPTKRPTTAKPTVNPLENLTHVKYLSHPYETLQSDEYEQLFCWVAFIIAVSVIAVVFYSKVNWKGMSSF